MTSYDQSYVEQFNGILRDASLKWLTPEKVLFILLNFDNLKLNLNSDPPYNPENGQLYIFDKEKTKNFKGDNVNWAKKKNTNRFQEAYDTLHVNGYDVHRVSCRSGDNPDFQRRIYRIISENVSTLVLVHYRLCSINNVTEHTINRINNSSLPTVASFQGTTLHQSITSINQCNYNISQNMQQHSQLYVENMLNYENTSIMTMQSSNMMTNNQDFNVISDNRNGVSYYGSEVDLEQSICQILDYAPSSCCSSVSEKVIIVLTQPLSHNVVNSLHSSSSSLEVVFGNVSVQATLLCPNIIRCYTPTNVGIGRYSIFITFDRVKQLTQPHNSCVFDFVDTLSTTRLNERHLTENNGYSDIGRHTERVYTGSTQRREREESTENMCVNEQNDEKEHKIRLIETTVPLLSSSLLHDNSNVYINTINSNTNDESNNSETNQFINGLDFVEFVRTRKINNNMSHHPSQPSSQPHYSNSDSYTHEPMKNFTDEVGNDHNAISSVDRFTNAKFDHEAWLDEQELGDLTAKELDELTQEYLTTVVTQLVQLATQDDDLIAELDSIDSHGFNFMHYSCLCNLATLVPMLLSKGANPNMPSQKEGKTPLHIAASLGHIELVKLLLANSVKVTVKDIQGKTPRDLAIANNHQEIVVLLSNAYEAQQNNGVYDDQDGELSYTQQQRTVTQSAGFTMYQDSDIPSVATRDHDEQLSISTTIIQDIFSSLTITEKCALAISIGNANAAVMLQQTYNSLAGTNSFLIGSNSNNNATKIETNMSDVDGDRSSLNMSNQSYCSDASDHDNILHDIDPFNTSSNSDKNADGSIGIGIGIGRLSGGTERFSATGGVATLGESESNKQRENEKQLRALEVDIGLNSIGHRGNLDVIMGMMGDGELTQIENEVKLIQSNVRGWLLRKNYKSLRQSALTLQNAWRERKRITNENELLTLSIPVVPVSNSTVGSHSSSVTSTARNSQRTNYSQTHVDMGGHNMSVCSSYGNTPLVTIVPTASDTTANRENMHEHTADLFNSDNDFFDFPDLDLDDFSFADYQSIPSNNIVNDNINCINHVSLPIDQNTCESSQQQQQLSINTLHLQQKVQSQSQPQSQSSHHIHPSPVKAGIVSLQAATRGMIARKAFSNIRKQAMVSVAIQKSLVQQRQKQESSSSSIS